MTANREDRVTQKASWEAFEESERAIRAAHFKRGIYLGGGFMVFGASLDLIVYPQYLGIFFVVRLLTLGLLLLGLIPLSISQSTKVIRLSGYWVVLLPMIAIGWMIYYTGDGGSPYYAGLNLVLVGASLLVRWRFTDSAIAAAICFFGFLAMISILPGDLSTERNNAYFILVTAVFSCAGTYYYNLLRFREFSLREELNDNRRILEAKNQELDSNREILEENNAKLKALDEAKTKFFANISHELRTPLTLILGPVEQLKGNATLQSDPRARDTLAILSDNGLRLLRLINDLLDLVRLDTGDVPTRLEDFEVKHFIESLGSSFLPMAESQQIALKIETDFDEHPVISCDRDQLEKIIMNLCVNALKFTPAGGKVALKMAEKDEEMQLEVSDTGKGMNQEELDHIFDRFWQADGSTKRKARGTGIGLALVESLVKNLGGRIEVRSKPNQGTTFTITFPLVPAQGALLEKTAATEKVEDKFDALHEKARLAAATPQNQQTARRAGQNEPVKPRSGQPRVLVVDDEDGMRRFIASQLEEYDLLEASDGRQGWELARQFQPDLIVLDLMMPEMDGMDVCKHLRNNPATARIPIILVTAHAGDAPRLEALRAGVNDFLTKPFSSVELQARVKNLLLSGQYERDLNSSNRELNEAIAQLQENEEQLVRAEKLSSLGRMSAGIVHEVNNPLNYAKTSIHILKTYSGLLPEDEREDYDDTIGDLADGVQRVIDIVTDLRSFTRGDETTQNRISLNKVLQNTSRLMAAELTSIDFSHDVPEDLYLEGNDNQLCQALVNMIQNALLAMEETENPTLRISAEKTPSGGILMEIKDNGSGITLENQAKIFDPFFTTRDVGDGMGLGLSLTLRIIEEHKGNIHVESEPGQGATFVVVFPPPPEDPSVSANPPTSGT